MSDNSLRVEPAPGIPGALIVTLDRPPVNAISLVLFKRVKRFFETLDEEHPDCTCIVLTGAGRMFCAGADVKELSERTVETQMARSVVSRGTFDALRRCPVPVICAVNGPAIGAGAVLASCCDIIVAAEGVNFSLPEILVGVMGGTRHMNRVLPEKTVRYMALTGRKLDAAELCALGAVQEVVPVDNLLSAALAIAADISANSSDATRLMKEAINLTEDMPLTEGYRVEQLFTTMASSMPDSKEAALAFVEKRKPVWRRTSK